MQGDGPRLSSRPWNNEYDGFAKSFFVKKERFQLLIRVFDIAPYNMERALLPEYESGSLYGMGGSQFRTKWLSANGILIRKDSLLKVIDIYDNMTIKQKKMIDLTDREYTLAIECLALTKD